MFVSKEPILFGGSVSRELVQQVGLVLYQPASSQGSESILFPASRFRYKRAGFVTSEPVPLRPVPLQATPFCHERVDFVSSEPFRYEATPFHHERVDFVSSEPVPFPCSPCDNDESTRGS
ncbi:hypothetical protein PGTUg99_018241 [Puccinia graminis f. sp. tritici]|uniref:Uncharacterized protein n=1 Tax=Puccinia graminis f. sp. tritici TaxID=56615 RepID=A0A5B0N3W9_PUCGR|nr:hypothetical protein PGTUg99_018241 [Puccinia graminis f. sp. tritici]